MTSHPSLSEIRLGLQHVHNETNVRKHGMFSLKNQSLIELQKKENFDVTQNETYNIVNFSGDDIPPLSQR